MKNNKINKLDITLTIFFIIIAIALIILSFYKIIKYKSLDAAKLETTILLILSLGYLFLKLLKDKNAMPTDIKGSRLPLSDNKDSKKKRIKSYILESIIFSIVVVCLDILAYFFLKDSDIMFSFYKNIVVNIIINILITFLMCFGISFLFEYIIGEFQVKNKLKKEK